MKFRQIPNTGLFFRFEFKKEDFWIGAFWKKEVGDLNTHLWICLLPCLPLHIFGRWTKIVPYTQRKQETSK